MNFFKHGIKEKAFWCDFHHILELDHQQYFVNCFVGIEVVKMAAS
jgi:hypothetical protein